MQKTFKQHLADSIDEKERVERGYRLLIAVNPHNDTIVEKYVNQTPFHKMVIEAGIKQGRLSK